VDGRGLVGKGSMRADPRSAGLTSLKLMEEKSKMPEAEHRIASRGFRTQTAG